MDAVTGNMNDDVAAQLGRLQDELTAIKEAIAATHHESCNCAACAEEASKMAQHAKERVQPAIGDLEAYIRDNPRAVIGGALGIGVLLGLFLRRH